MAIVSALNSDFEGVSEIINDHFPHGMLIRVRREYRDAADWCAENAGTCARIKNDVQSVVMLDTERDWCFFGPWFFFKDPDVLVCFKTVFG